MTFEEGKVISNRYKLKRKLGQGSFGHVWLAYNMLADIDVAIKFYGAFDDKGIEEFRNEFKTAYKLHHPNLLNISHFDVFEKCPYLVMPYCANGSVNSYIGKFSETEIWKFILDVSCGLSFLHSQYPHIIHQDIKPENILITNENCYIISDFGISSSFRSQLSKTRNNMNSSGTIPYMGPERFSKKAQIVLASDIWAFGMTVYEILTGKVLWEGTGGCAQLNGAHLPAINNISQELSQLILACLAKETWNRPTAAQIYEYALMHIQNKNLPSLKSHMSSMLQMENQDNLTRIKTSHRDESYLSHTSNQKLKVLQNVSIHKNKNTKNVWYKRIAATCAACVIVFVTFFSIIYYHNSIREQKDFISCKTKEDFEQFIKKYPSSDFCITARKSISTMTPKEKQEDRTSKTEEYLTTDFHNTNQKQIKLSPKQKITSNHIVEKTSKNLSLETNYNAAEDDQLFYSCQTTNDLRNYLNRYPNGRHSADALQAINNNMNMQNGIVNSGVPINTRRYPISHRNHSNSTTSIKISIK